MARLSATLIPIALVAAGLASCDAESTAPGNGVEIQVDSAVYHLRSMSGGVWYDINMNVTVVNKSDKTAYLSQGCGNYNLRRANNDDTRLMLGEYACALPGGVPIPQPIAIAAGDSYSKPYHLLGSNSPQTRPTITIENNTGTLVFRYAFTNPEGTKGVYVSSAPFKVVPPAQ